MSENERYCKDCKHCKGIGYDFWCGEGHTEYEVFLNETNCPYYEFHDWSKGTPNRTENKRFTAPDRYRFSHSKIQLNGEPLINDEIVRVLNVNDGAFVENFNLKKENKELKEENEQLKQENRKLKEDLEHCANQFTNDGKNVLLSLR